jgi:actin-related protein
VVPIYEGVTIQHAIQRSDIAGQDITDFLTRRIFDSGVKQTKKRIEEIKKWNCYIPANFDKEVFLASLTLFFLC